MVSVRHRTAGFALAAAASLAACGATHRDSVRSLDPRFVAVHNALAAMGLAQVGPIQQGVLPPEHEVRTRVVLPAGCVTLVAFGGEGVLDLDATLLDARGAPVAHDTTAEPQAVLHACVDVADTYTVVVRAAVGGGPWVLATWVGGAAAGNTPGAPEQVAAAPRGTCEAPLPLTVGTVTGSTSRGDFENTGSCGPSDSREIVYQIDVHDRQRFTFAVEAKFDTVLYVRKDACADPSSEIDCNDDAPDRSHSRVEHVLDPGKYFVFVDGYGHESGAFKLTVTATPVLALSDVCQHAPWLAQGPPQGGSTEANADDAQASCGNGAHGPESAWQMELPSRSRVRLVEHSDDLAPVVHVRHACADPRSEIACGESGSAPGDAAVTGLFAAGRYAVFADGRDPGSAGSYLLSFETAPPVGSGVAGDGCGDAVPLGGAGSSAKTLGDTFAARDDVAGTCGGAGAADVVYRLDVQRRSRLTASLEGEEASHVVVVTRRCGDRSAEVACGRSVDEILGPGPYFVAIDGATADSIGRFALTWALHDLTGQSAACTSAVSLAEGSRVDGTTAGAGDRFTPSCTSSDTSSGPDRAFKLVLPSRRVVRVEVNAGFDAAVSLRRTCGDAPGVSSPELACETGSDANRHVIIERTLDAGTYWVVVDGQSATDLGPFTISYRSR